MNRFIIVAIIFSCAVLVRSETNQSGAPSPTTVVSNLYKAHDGKADPLQYPASKKLLGAYFDKSLLSLFLKDQSESQGEVGKLEFDPLYEAQDFEIKDFSVVKVSENKGSAEVAVTFKNMGKSERILYSLSDGDKGWRISDIKYHDGLTLKGILK